MPVSQRAGVRYGVPVLCADTLSSLSIQAPAYFRDGGRTISLMPSSLSVALGNLSGHLICRRVWLHPELTPNEFVSIGGLMVPLASAGSVISSRSDVTYSPGNNAPRPIHSIIL